MFIFVVFLAAVLLVVRFALEIKLHIYRRKRSHVKTIVVLGSGGHTAEMFSLLRGFDLSVYSPRRYIVAATDAMSAQKATTFETEWREGQHRQHPIDPLSGTHTRRPTLSVSSCEIRFIPRSREVGQSFLSSVPTTLRALFHSTRAVFAFCPDLVLLNGPGTAVPVAAAAVAARLMGVADAKVVYVESIARVNRLSLTGKLLYHLRLADEFLVQWEELRVSYPRAAFAGRLL